MRTTGRGQNVRSTDAVTKQRLTSGPKEVEEVADDRDERAREERAKRFGAALATARLNTGFSQHTLATAVKSTQSTISAWERGESEPPPDTVFEFERAMHLDPGELSQLLGYMPLVPSDTMSAIASDPALDAERRQWLIDIYKMMRNQKEAR